ncbi:hypothetical protein PIB30_045731 [Stylosanthes scabra]|uniref:Uncharacterized protein n=1 Tax=Stylosanthes scabra TaxID=79078 RepID=A0ABU6YGH6_9FABA|nr:hypothetical protein [Stylosanthes scabra]
MVGKDIGASEGLASDSPRTKFVSSREPSHSRGSIMDYKPLLSPGMPSCCKQYVTNWLFLIETRPTFRLMLRDDVITLIMGCLVGHYEFLSDWRVAVFEGGPVL